MIQIDGSKYRDMAHSLWEILSGRSIPCGAVNVTFSLPDSFAVLPRANHFELRWTGKIEADLPGPINPDVMSIRLYRDRCVIDLRVSGVEITWGDAHGGRRAAGADAGDDAGGMDAGRPV